MPENKIVVHLNGITRNLSKEDRKKLTSDPAPLAEKWGKLQIDMLKKLSELEAADKQMKDAILAFSASLKKFREQVPDGSKKSAELLAQLCNEQKRVFQQGIDSRMHSLAVFEKVVI